MLDDLISLSVASPKQFRRLKKNHGFLDFPNTLSLDKRSIRSPKNDALRRDCEKAGREAVRSHIQRRQMRRMNNSVLVLV